MGKENVHAIHGAGLALLSAVSGAVASVWVRHLKLEAELLSMTGWQLLLGSLPLIGLSAVLESDERLLAIFVLLRAFFPEELGVRFESMQETVLFSFKWYFVGVVSFVLVFMLWLGFGRYRNVRLGGDDECPEFTYMSWFSMLFAAGMGIGLIFWSIAEPLSHYESNPMVPSGRTAEAASAAMKLTFFHWGLSAWAVYALMAVGLGYFAFRRKRPLTPRSMLYETIGRYADGHVGHIVNIVTVFGAAFGIATSLGLGVQQIEGGLAYLGAPEAGLARELTILAITGGSALYLEVFKDVDLVGALHSDITRPLYRAVEVIAPGPLSPIISALLILLVAMFFVTSSDSGTLVISTVLSEGAEEPPKPLRVVWGVTEGAVAGILPVVGGLNALQTAAIVAGLPVALLLVVVMISIVRGLHAEPQAPRQGGLTRAQCEPWAGCHRVSSQE